MHPADAKIVNRFPGLDFGLGETLDMLRETAQHFAASEIAPRAAEIDRSNEFPADLWRKLGSLGCSASRWRRSTAAARWAISRTSSRWKRSAAPRPRWAYRTAPTPIYA